ARRRHPGLPVRHRPGRPRHPEPHGPRRADLAAGRRPRRRGERADRRDARARERLRRRARGHGLDDDRGHHVVVSAAPSRARLRGRAGAEPGHDRPGAGLHGLGALRAGGARRGAGAAREGLHRSRARDGRGLAAHPARPRAAQHVLVHRRALYAASGAGDPGRGCAVVPRRGLRPYLSHVGADDCAGPRLRERGLVAGHLPRPRHPRHRPRHQPGRRPLARRARPARLSGMLYASPTLDRAELDVIARIEEIRGQIRFVVADAGDTTRGLLPLYLPGESNDPAFAGYRAALGYVLHLHDDPHFAYDATLLRSLHYMSLAHEPDKSPARWPGAAIRVRGAGIWEVLYEPPPPEAVPHLVRELMDHLNDKDDRPAFVRAAVAHLNLVQIHPFADGNGRLGRALHTLVLVRHGILDPEFASIEQSVARDRDGFREALYELGTRW